MVAIGAPTDVAAAIRRDPSVVDDIVVVWLGGQPPAWPTADEFNVRGDPAAARTLFDSGVPLVHVPCKNVAEHLTTSVAELERHLDAIPGSVGAYLLDAVRSYRDRRSTGQVWTTQIWDLAPVAALVDPSWIPTALVHSPTLTAELTWNRDPDRHLVRVARDVDRDAVFEDALATIDGIGTG